MIRILALLLALALPCGAWGQVPTPSQPSAAIAAQQSLQPSAGSVYNTPFPSTTAFGNDNDNVPIPDPTALTTQQLYREILLARQFSTQEVEALRKVLETRLDAIDTATDLRIKPIEDLSEVIKNSIDSLKQLQDEKFKSIQTQFIERDIRGDQAETKNKTAIDAALQAQEKSVNDKNESNAQAIAKSEAGFTKQIDGLRDQNAANVDAVAGQIGDLKQRLTAIEARSVGGSEAYGGLGTLAGILIAAVGLGVAVFVSRR